MKWKTKGVPPPLICFFLRTKKYICARIPQLQPFVTLTALEVNNKYILKLAFMHRK